MTTATFATPPTSLGVPVVTNKPQPTFTDVVRTIHDCPPENTSCNVLYYIATALGVGLDIGIDDALLSSRRTPWPTCLLCNRCLVEPELWRFPLEPHRNLLCAPCLLAAADPPITFMEFPSEENFRRDWLVKEVASGREMRPFPGDVPARQPYRGPNDASLFAKIKAAVPVEVLAGRFTDLRPAGPGKLKGCCPLHQESTPSFHIWTEKGTWRCFGACAIGGDVIKFVGLLFTLEPKSAAAWLAKEFGIDIPVDRGNRPWRDRRGHLHLPRIEVEI